jgi:hypothetical protein
MVIEIVFLYKYKFIYLIVDYEKIFNQILFA